MILGVLSWPNLGNHASQRRSGMSCPWRRTLATTLCSKVKSSWHSLLTDCLEDACKGAGLSSALFQLQISASHFTFFKSLV